MIPRFRAWDKDSKMMWTPDFIWLVDGRPGLKGALKGKGSIYDCPVMLSTGLLDKNGKEIFEEDVVVMVIRENIGTFNVPDDIIANGGYTGKDDIYEGKITYNTSTACFGLEDKENGFVQLISGEDILLEKIGNGFENPELLTEEKT